MCTNFTPTQNPQWVQQAFGVDLPQGYPAESYPSYPAPVVVKSHRSVRVVCGLARFGLIPPWAKDSKIARHTYNARSETVAEKASFKHAWHQRQFGLLLVDNFYEPSYETGKAVRWRIALASGDPFGIACLWERWTDLVSRNQVVSFAMLTVNADEHSVMNRFHHPTDEKRTPVVIAPELHDAWLSADFQQAIALMHWHHMPELVAVPAPK